MQFKNPEILYFLFALLVPVLVHLFQLKKFKTMEFSNVALLKEIRLQTRKSSQIKKWLLLVCRLFLLAALIFAFAQPYFPAKNPNLKTMPWVIALDNSFSMQAQGAKGPLLPRAVQEILETIPKNQTFSLLTNNQSFWEIDLATNQTELQQITYSAHPFSIQNTQHILDKHFNRQPYRLLVISDGIFANYSTTNHLENAYLYQMQAVNKTNVAIQSSAFNGTDSNFNVLEITLQGYGIQDSLSFSLSVNDANKLYSKTKVTLGSASKKVTINLPKQPINGQISIDTPDLEYDNHYYFSIEAPQAIKVGVVGTSIPEIEKIFNPQQVVFESVQSAEKLSDFSTILINQQNTDLNLWGSALKKAYNQGSQIIYIPSLQVTTAAHNDFLSHFGALKFSTIQTFKNSITQIHTDHSVYKNVFEHKPEKQTYPTTSQNFVLQGTVLPILSYANNETYLGNLTNGLGNLYVFSSDLQLAQSSILQAPIIVPTFYNMVTQQQENQLQNFGIYSTDSWVINGSFNQKQPIELEGKKQSGIPQQQPIGNKTKIGFENFPDFAGNYIAKQENKPIASVGLNYNRSESNLTLSDAKLFNNFVPVESVNEALVQMNQNNSGTALWKYFILTTLLFLILELLIQKFVK
ncbi:BatA domain-containing protein [Flavobacterium agricola]|uniref:BatA domain-containing protein n=1 Tax=Flavobacterium agricola TaxID=2870839 RepID=A0ABY6M1W6_9FLAO|nr:BatA domain-containing protein [Flavobacterium agricola]UYW02553.1 BatA domain-containing protein [Flavobacterium agricola]